MKWDMREAKGRGKGREGEGGMIPPLVNKFLDPPLKMQVSWRLKSVMVTYCESVEVRQYTLI